MENVLKIITIGFSVSALSIMVYAQKPKEPVGYVNPLNGTAPLEDLSLYGGPKYNPDPKDMYFSGLVYPSPNLPHGLVKLSPLTEVIYDTPQMTWTHGSGYYYPDSTIVAFAHTNQGHWRGGNVPIMPTIGKLRTHPGSAENPDEGFRSRFSHDNESVRAGYYSVWLEDYDIKAELTASRYVGFHKYTFPETKDGHIIIDLSHAIENVQQASVEFIDNQRMRGMQNEVFFCAEFSKPFDSYGTWEGEVIKPSSRTASGNNIGAYVDYEVDEGEEILIKVGISMVSMEKAEKNLKIDAGSLDFENVMANATGIWNRKLKMIEIEGGTEAQRTNFYTSLYRAMLWPPVISDVDGEYRYEDKVYQTDNDYYAAPPLWDAFRNHMPLLIILEPEVKINILRSFIERAEKSGWMDTQFQGNHAAPVFASSLLAGLEDFDVEKAYYFLKKNQTMPSGPVPYVDEFNNLGYIAAVQPPPDDYRSAPHRSSVAKTLEYSYDAYCLALIAEKLKKNDDREMFMEHAAHYKNVYDASTGFMRPKKEDGTWVEPFDPEIPRFMYAYREANAWQNTWFVPHDVEGLIHLMEGREAFNNKLDSFFTTPYEPEWTLIDIAGMIGQYCHSNQPDHQVPYFYNYAGKPWKTQKIVREILDKMYQGLVYTGMDDCGEMASWYVWSAMGFYPVSPVHLTYQVGSPIFEKVTIHLPEYHYGGKTFVIKADHVSEEDKYIQSAELNGRPYDKPWILHSNILAGDTIVFKMGPEPNTAWGNLREDVSPSQPID